jgi:hypothetical protein
VPNTRTLPQIAKAIKALEKKTIQNVVEIGKLLEEASKKCDHGQYREWLKTEFGWSHDTARNYRSVYNFTQKTKISSFGKLNISISALYLAAKLTLNEHWPPHQAAGKAIIKAALKERVSYSMAKAIWEKSDQPPPKPPPEPPLDDDEPPDDDEQPPDGNPDDEPDDDAPPNDLATALTTVLSYSECNAAWPKAIKAIGRIQLREIIEVLNSVYEKHCGRDAVRTAADRAEAKAALMAKTPN